MKMAGASEAIGEIATKPFEVIYDLLPALPLEFGFNPPVPRFVARKMHTEKLGRKTRKAEAKYEKKRRKIELKKLKKGSGSKYWS